MDGALFDLLAVLSSPTTMREVWTLAVLLGVAWLIARRLRPHVGQPMVRRTLSSLAFPIAGIMLIGPLSFVAHREGWRLHFAHSVMLLLWAMIAIRMVLYALQHAFPHATWIRGFGRTVAAIVWLALALDLIGVLADLLDWLDSFRLPLGKTSISLLEIMQGFASVAGSLLVALWLAGMIEARLMQARELDSSVRVVLSRIVHAVLILAAVLIGAEMVGLDITALSVFGGALGVGLGLGMQKIASSYVSGFIILLDRSIKIGNLIQVGSERGEVLNITTRYTVLRSLSGAHFIVPNDTLVGSTVQNDSFVSPNTRVAVQVQVGYGTDVEAVLPMIEDIGRQQDRVLADPAPTGYLVSFDDSGMTLELGVWIADPGNGTLGLRSSLNREILRRFRAAGIEIPFPQREVRMIGLPPAGSAAS